VSAARACLCTPAEAQLAVKSLLKEPTSIVSLFIQIQRLLAVSSLDQRVATDWRRYDQTTDQPHLPERDATDSNLVDVGGQLRKAINAALPCDEILERYPIEYLEPLNNVVHQEVTCYRVLLEAISHSVQALVATLDGQYPRPQEVEDLWSRIQANKVPEKWLSVCYITARTNLADFLVGLSLKLEFWRGLVSRTNILDTPAFWLPAFHSPKAFLRVFAQHRARNEGIAVDVLARHYDVQPFF
jgi:dynein heavy chain